MDEYKKMNNEPIAIECVPDEHEESRDYEPSFWYGNKRHFLSDFIRCHDNPWASGRFPEYIHGYEAEEYYHPLFIHLYEDTAVDVYESV